MGVKTGLSHQESNIGCGFWRIGSKGIHLGLQGKKYKRSGYNRLLAFLSKYYSGDQSRSMEWAVHEACRVLVDKSEGNRLPVKPGVN